MHIYFRNLKEAHCERKRKKKKTQQLSHSFPCLFSHNYNLNAEVKVASIILSLAFSCLNLSKINECQLIQSRRSDRTRHHVTKLNLTSSRNNKATNQTFLNSLNFFVRKLICALSIQQHTAQMHHYAEVRDKLQDNLPDFRSHSLMF